MTWKKYERTSWNIADFLWNKSLCPASTKLLKTICAVLLSFVIYIAVGHQIAKSGVDIPSTDLSSPHHCAYPKPVPWFPTAYDVVSYFVQCFEVIVQMLLFLFFVLVELLNHCLNFLFKISVREFEIWSIK